MPIYKKLTRYIGVFLLFFTLYFTMQLMLKPFLGYDAYYHAKHSELIAQSGNLTLVRPWVDNHFLSSTPADPYWLFHVLTAGFIYLFGTVIGIKIISSLAAASIFFIFFFILNKFKFKYPFVFTLLFFISSSSFLFRTILERPYVISIAILLLVLYCIEQRRYILLFIISTLYMLLYHLIPVLLLPAIIYIIINFKNTKKSIRPLFVILSGVTCGIILHPYTLNFIWLIYIQSISTFILKIQGIALPSGMEIKHQDSSIFLTSNLFTIISFTIASATYFFFIMEKKINKVYTFLFANAILWFFVALMYPRGIEYWLPFTWLFIAGIFSHASSIHFFIPISAWCKQHLYPRPIKIFICSGIIALLFITFSQVMICIYTNNTKSNIMEFQKVSNFLISHTPKNSRVYYATWSTFPKLFFFDTHNIYLSAFDPIFTYTYNNELFWIQHNIGLQGLYCTHQPPCTESYNPKNNLKSIDYTFKHIFNSPYILIDKQINTPLNNILVHKNMYKKIYENNMFLLYEVL